MLCTDCSRIGLNADGVNGLMTESFDYRLKESYTLLEESANAGCDCCAIVMNSLVTPFREDIRLEDSVYLRRGVDMVSVQRPYLDDITIHFGATRTQLRIFTTDGNVRPVGSFGQ